MMTLSEPKSREVAPASHHRWLDDKEGKFQALEADFENWKSDAEGNLVLFKKHIYENQNANELDYREHRRRICHILAAADAFYFRFIDVAADHEVEEKLKVLNTVIDQYSQLFCDWHAPTGWADTVPDSFKHAILDIAAGKVVSMEKALSDPP